MCVYYSSGSAWIFHWESVSEELKSYMHHNEEEGEWVCALVKKFHFSEWNVGKNQSLLMHFVLVIVKYSLCFLQFYFKNHSTEFKAFADIYFKTHMPVSAQLLFYKEPLNFLNDPLSFLCRENKVKEKIFLLMQNLFPVIDFIFGQWKPYLGTIESHEDFTFM